MTAETHDVDMGRDHRIDIENGWYHVMNRGVNKQTVFFADADRVEFGRLLGLVHARFGIDVIAYCLMGNHYHLVLHCPDGGLSDAMHLLGSVLTRHTNERVGRDGPLCRGRFHSVVIDSDEQLLNTVRYVHRNPLDIAGIEAADEYRWSSHRSYIGCRRSPEFLSTNEVLDHFGGDPGAFGSFVRKELPVRLTERPLPTVEQLASTVTLVLDEVLRSDVVRAHVCRTVMVLMLELLPPSQRDDLAGRLAFATAKSQQQAQRRAAARARDEPVLQVIARRVLDLLA